jgi:hypothetical protein
MCRREGDDENHENANYVTYKVKGNKIRGKWVNNV